MNFASSLATQAVKQAASARRIGCASTLKRAFHNSKESCHSPQLASKDLCCSQKHQQRWASAATKNQQSRQISLAAVITKETHSSPRNQMTMRELVKALEPITRAREASLRTNGSSLP